jgi:hypothetical protein
MLAERRNRLGFPFKQLLPPEINGTMEELDGHVPAKRFVASLIDFPETSLAKEFNNLIRAQVCAHKRICTTRHCDGST